MYPAFHAVCSKDFKHPIIERPKIVGYFSLDGNETFHPDASQLKFIREVPKGPVFFDLNKRIEAAILKETDNAENVSFHILKYLLFEKQRNNSQIGGKKLNDSKFVCNRGLLTAVAVSPFTRNWGDRRIMVTLFKGVIYMCTRDTASRWNMDRKLSREDLLFTSWGYKFEQYIVSDNPHAKPVPDEPCDEREEFYLVFNSKLNEHDLIYSGETDGMRVNSAPPPRKEDGYEAMLRYLQQQKYYEIKTSKRPTNQRMAMNFRRNKALKIWCQSYLAGIEEVICGFRNDDGIVKEIKIFNVNTMPDECENFWNRDTCLNFLDSFLCYVKKCLTQCITSKHGEQALNELDALEPITLHFEWIQGGVKVTQNYNEKTDNIIPEWFAKQYQ